MVLESTVVCVDSSDYMRNGDFEPTRLDAQHEAAKLIFDSKARSNPGNNIALLTLARIEILATLTTDVRHLVSKLNEIKPKGCIDFVTALRTARLVLRNRPDKFYKMRIVVFVGSPVTSDEEELACLAKRLKKEKVKVDIVNFGDDVFNNGSLTSFLSILNEGGDGGSRMVSVPPGNVLWHVLANSSIVQAEDSAPFTYNTGNFSYDFEDDDPTVALALRVSMEEYGQTDARQAMTNTASGAAEESFGDGAGIDEELLERLLSMSLGTEPAAMGTAPRMLDYTLMTEEEKLAYAVQISLQLYSLGIPDQDLPDALATEEEQMEALFKEPPKLASESDAACNAAGDTIQEDHNKNPADTGADEGTPEEDSAAKEN